VVGDNEIHFGPTAIQLTNGLDPLVLGSYQLLSRCQPNQSGAKLILCSPSGDDAVNQNGEKKRPDDEIEVRLMDRPMEHHVPI
jgi:hypothetical protein